MSTIVVSTMLENIKSFFQREEALSTPSKKVPEAASEALEKHTATEQTPQRIVEKPLPKQTVSLPFTPEQLRSALQTPPASVAAPKPMQEPVIVREKVEPRDITHEIDAFERALKEVHVPKEQTEHKTYTTEYRPQALTTPHIQQDGFFDEFEQFLNREDLEAEGILEKDVLWRMKEFHRHRQAGKEFYLYSKDMQGAVQRKLSELKSLEKEWFVIREQTDALERDLSSVEHDIESRAADLRELLRQAKNKSRLERKAPQGMEFHIRDGRVLTSLLELRQSLRNMTPETFAHHVGAEHNDFADWAKAAFHDHDLAAQINTVKDKSQLEVVLSRLT